MNHGCLGAILTSHQAVITTTFAVSTATIHLDSDILCQTRWKMKICSWVNPCTGKITARAFAFGTTRFHFNQGFDRISIYFPCSPEMATSIVFCTYAFLPFIRTQPTVIHGILCRLLSYGNFYYKKIDNKNFKRLNWIFLAHYRSRLLQIFNHLPFQCKVQLENGKSNLRNKTLHWNCSSQLPLSSMTVTSRILVYCTCSIQGLYTWHLILKFVNRI